MTDKDPRWQRYAALAIALGLALACYLFRARLGADFWPPDDSRVGPNLVAAVVQTGIVLIVLALVYPPFRRAAHRFVDRKTAGLHAKLDTLRERHDQHEESLAVLHKRLEDLHKKLDAQPKRDAK